MQVLPAKRQEKNCMKICLRRLWNQNVEDLENLVNQTSSKQVTFPIYS